MFEIRDVECAVLTNFNFFKTFENQSKKLCLDFCHGSWIFIRFFTDKALSKNFDLNRFFTNAGIIINVIFYIAQHKCAEFYKLVIATSYFDFLLKKLKDFHLVVDYDPFEPAEKDIHIHENWEVKRKARINTLKIAVEAIRNEWNQQSTECYREIIKQADLEIELEKLILNWDSQMSYSHICFLTYLTENV